MANTVNVEITNNGQRNMTLAVYLRSDGATGDLNGHVLVTPADAGMTEDGRFSIHQVIYNFAGFDASLEFDSGLVTPTLKWVLTEGANAQADFTPFGGLRDTSGIDGTGNLRLSTVGFSSVEDQGSILLVLHKHPNG